MELYPYTLKRSRRKTLAVQITQEGTVKVMAPMRLPQSTIERFLQEKQPWILKHVSKAQERQRAKSQFGLQPGDELWLLGKSYPLVYGNGKRANWDGQRFLVPEEPFEERRKKLIGLYRQMGREYLLKQVAHYSEKMGVAPQGVKISSAKKRWGSCSGRDSLNFSWRLIMAPPRAVEYVVVHELAHIREHNHSQRFWNIVEKQMPDYRQRQELLRQVYDRIATENWDDPPQQEER